MSSELEAAIRTSLQEASEHLTPDPDLADQVRRATRRRRVRLAIAGSLATAIIVSAGGYVVAAPGQHWPPWLASGQQAGHGGGTRVRFALSARTSVESMAVAGHDVYVATDDAGMRPYALSAYDRMTGRLIRRVTIPAMPVALRTGPGGSVWLTFIPDQAGGPSGTWLLTADLGAHSSSSAGPYDLLPTGPDTALLSWENGMREVRMPAPGQPGKAVVRPDPAWRVRGRFAVDELVTVTGRVVARVSSDFVGPHLVITDLPRLTFGGGHWGYVEYVTAQDGGLWATTRSRSDTFGPLVRLSSSLRVITPGSFRASPILARSEQVWSDGATVWVSTAAAGHRLVCFSYRGVAGPITAVRVPGHPVELAGAGDVVYVSFASDQVGVLSGVRAYAVPAACR